MKKEKILGLDIGVSSVGWAINEKTEDNKLKFINGGVRLFDAPEDNKTLKTNTSKRRGYRSAKRMEIRKKRRKQDLIKLFLNNNLINKEELTNADLYQLKPNSEKDPFIFRYNGLSKKLDNKQLLIALLHISNRRGYNNMFEIEDESDDKEKKKEKGKREGQISKGKDLIKKYKYPIVSLIEDPLFNFSQKGNFISKAIQFKEKSFKINYLKKNNLKKLDKEHQKDYDAKLKVEQEKLEKYQILFLRKHFIDEVEATLDKQIELGNEKLKELKDTIINKIIFRQRFFEDGPGKGLNGVQKYKPFTALVGRCEFYPKENRLSNFSIDADISFILNETSKIMDQIQKENGEIIDNNILKKLNYSIFEHYFDNLKFDKEFVLKQLSEYNIEGVKFNGISFANAHLYLVKLNKLLKNKNKDFTKKWEQIFNQELKEIKKLYLSNELNLEQKENLILNKLGELLTNNITPLRRQEKLKKLFPNLDYFPNVDSNIKRLKVSSKFINRALQAFLNEGITIGRFSAQFKKDTKTIIENEKDLIKFLEPLKDKDMQRNSVVFRSVNETIKLVNKLIKKYGNFSFIVIETAKDLYAEQKLRKNIRKNQDNNQKTRESIEKYLGENGIPINNTNIFKVKLFSSYSSNFKFNKELSNQNIIDFYDIKLKNKINLKDFLLNNNDYQIDHIIPRGSTSDNSFTNQIVVLADVNRDKGKRTPIEYFKSIGKSNKEILSWKTKILSMKIFEAFPQRLNNLTQETTKRNNGFERVDINDTRYISKYIYDYFKQQLEGYSKIDVLKGKVTSQFRKLWLSDSLWGNDKKVRDITPFHHFVDALILASMEDKQHIEFYQQIVALFENYNYFKNTKFVKEHNIRTIEQFKLWYNNYINDIIKTINTFNGFSKNKELRNYFYGIIKNIERLTNSYLDGKSNLRDVRFINFTNDFTIRKYLLPPFEENFKIIVENFIPIKLKEGTSKIKYKVWNKETSKFEEKEKDIIIPLFSGIIKEEEYYSNPIVKKYNFEYPYVSYKITKRIRHNMLAENAISFSNLNKDKLDMYVLDNQNNYWEKKGYWGWYKNEDGKWESIRYYDVWKNYTKNKKRIKGQTITKNTLFKYKGEIYRYVSLSGDTIIAVHPNIMNKQYNDFVKTYPSLKRSFNKKILNSQSIVIY